MRSCETCGKNIDHKRADAKFCDNTCRSRRWAEGLPSPAEALPPGEAAPVPREVTPPEVIVGLTRAEVAAMIEAALQPIRAETRRVDQTSASTDVTDALHGRMETVEERLFGARDEGRPQAGKSIPPGVEGAILARLSILELSVQIGQDGLADDVRRLRNEAREVGNHLAAFMTILFEFVLGRFGVDLQPKVREKLHSKA